MKRAAVVAFLVLIGANAAILCAQWLASAWGWRHTEISLLPEMRYFVQSLILLVPIAVGLLMKSRWGGKILVLLTVLLVAHGVIYLVKAHVPGTRRYQYTESCKWAADEIRHDYTGPREDAEPFFTELDYHRLSRPVVDAHVTRLAYMLGGRASSLTSAGILDIPDYIVGEPHKLNRDWWYVADYAVLAERKFGKRNFIIYKRIK